MRRALIAAAALIAIPAAHAQDRPEDKVAAIFAELGGPAMPGCAVGLFERDKTLLVRGYGSGDIARGTALDGDTLFYAASNSKQFTAIAIAQFVEAGKVSLSDDVRKWVPEMPDYGTPITVEMLLHHSSGLADFVGLLAAAGFTTLEKTTPDMLLKLIARQQRLQFEPGTQYAYNNSGYFLLAQIVERAAGKPFAEVVRERILAPLGMKASYMRSSALNPAGARVAHGYKKDAGGAYQVTDTYPALSGSGGLMTSVNDLAKFERDFLYGSKVWTPAVRAMIARPGKLTSGTEIVYGPEASYGMGLVLGKLRGKVSVGHAGGHEAFVSQITRLPELGLSGVILCNRAGLRASSYLERVIEVYRGDALGPKPAPAAAAASGGPIGEPLPPESVRELAGRYRAEEIETTYDLVAEGNTLKVIGQSAYAPTPASPPWMGEFRMVSPNVIRSGQQEFLVVRSKDGKVNSLRLYLGRGGAILFVREKP